MNRREFLKLSAFSKLSMLVPSYVGKIYAEEHPLHFTKDIANTRGLDFGTSFDVRAFPDVKYLDLIKRNCNCITVENSLKWRFLSKYPSSYDFNQVDRILAFMKDAGIRVRGHALMFAKENPQWLKLQNCESQRSTIISHINTLVGRYDSIKSWDVLNEVLDADGSNYWLVKDDVYDCFGDKYIRDILSGLRQVGFHGELVVNEWIGPYDDRYFSKRRTACLRYLEYIKTNELAVDTVGIQSHLNFDGRYFSPNEWESFVKEITQLGFDVRITELDMVYSGKSRDDNRVLSSAYSYLQTLFENANVRGLQVWGLMPQYSYAWLKEGDKRKVKYSTLYDQDGVVTRFGEVVHDALMIGTGN